MGVNSGMYRPSLIKASFILLLKSIAWWLFSLAVPYDKYGFCIISFSIPLSAVRQEPSPPCRTAGRDGLIHVNIHVYWG